MKLSKHHEELDALLAEYVRETLELLSSFSYDVLSGENKLNEVNIFKDMAVIHSKFANKVKKVSYITYLFIVISYFFKTIPVRFELLKIDFQREHYRKFIMASLTAYIVFFILAITYILVMVLK